MFHVKETAMPVRFQPRVFEKVAAYGKSATLILKPQHRIQPLIPKPQVLKPKYPRAYVLSPDPKP